MTMTTSFASSSFTHRWTYDVFLSFRGKDTRMGFTGNLYKALEQNGIYTFMDDKKLRKGEEITLALMDAIQESRIAIVIFSKNYASSSFCLEELVKIMECIKYKGRLVWPVFYQVDPSDVRHQKRSYAEALAKHERRIKDTEKVKRWRFALQEAANLSGWHYKNGYEYKFIQRIMEEVSKRVNLIPLHVSDNPVGLNSRIQKVKSLLDVESNDGVHMVGIYGTGGIGKTTLACAVYNFISDHFESLCFLDGIRENSKHGLVHLQEKLLSELAVEKDIKLGYVNKGISIIKRKLCKKKILLILDDVDRREQLKALAGGLDWFGLGSRIIITTRDKHLLDDHSVERTYEVKELNHEEALELFSCNAFKSKEVDPNYLDLSNRVILYSNGLPLSLEIIGSDLFGKTVLEWKSALDTYGRIPHENIQKVLRVSFDGLKKFEQKVFLDMACFFNGYKLSDVKNMLLSGRSLASDYAIGVLIDKCLIKIVECHVRMHNLIEDMGREIVEQESPLEPGERSRLWFSKDILRVFEENKGSNKTEIIMLHLPEEEDVQWDGNALKEMENLKILVIENACFSKGPNHLPKCLRVLKWCGYPESSLPVDFDPKELVMLDLCMSSVTLKTQLIMEFKSLTEMNLSGCQLLEEVPDMSGAPSLKKLHLDSCKKLVKVHNSIGLLGKLEVLNLNLCTSLRVLPRSINLTSLKTMSLRNCASLESFPEISAKMENLRYLGLNDSAITDLPNSIGNLVGLTILTLNGCTGLLELSSSLFTLPKLEILQAKHCDGLLQIRKDKGQVQETTCSNVRDATFGSCYLTNDFVGKLLPWLQHVTDLSLNRSNITILPSSIVACVSLTKLALNECKKLEEMKGLPPHLKYLSAINCTLLSSKSRDVLITQMQLMTKTGDTHFLFPGSSIPRWFSYKNRGPTLHFWFRNKFPYITVCVVGVLGGFVNCKLHLFINNIQKFQEITLCAATNYSVHTNHIIVSDLQHEFVSEKLKRLNIEKGWMRAEFSVVDNGGITDVEWMGVCVKEPLSDVRLTNPEVSVVKEENKVCNSSMRDFNMTKASNSMEGRKVVTGEVKIGKRKDKVRKREKNHEKFHGLRNDEVSVVEEQNRNCNRKRSASSMLGNEMGNDYKRMFPWHGCKRDPGTRTCCYPNID